MSAPVVWLQIAIAEFKSAVTHYDKVNPKLALSFGEAVDGTIDIIGKTPLIYAVRLRGIRRAALRRFPYSIYFVVEEKRILIVAVQHAKRDPERWQTRYQ